jgi:hypothetical protein
MSTSNPLGLITAQLNIALPALVVMDLNTIWLQHYNATPIETLAQPCAATDTTLVLTAAAPPELAPGPILVDNEPMLISAIDATRTILTVSRAATSYPFLSALPSPPSTTHAAGASIRTLNYPDPWAMIADLALRPWTVAQVNNLGATSYTFGAQVTGTLLAGGPPSTT